MVFYLETTRRASVGFRCCTARFAFAVAVCLESNDWAVGVLLLAFHPEVKQVAHFFLSEMCWVAQLHIVRQVLLIYVHSGVSRELDPGYVSPFVLGVPT